MKKVDLKIVFIFALLLLAGCSEDIKPTPYTYSQIFSGKNQKTWKYKSIILWEEGKADTNFTLNPCISDDLYVFYANVEKKYEVTNGTSKCTSDEPEIVLTDTWSFINGGATLNIIVPFLSDLSLPYIVREISDGDMLLEIFINQENTQSYRIAFESVGEN
jgi:Prokaryotic membrane lipoprotein lipid attachment site